MRRFGRDFFISKLLTQNSPNVDFQKALGIIGGSEKLKRLELKVIASFEPLFSITISL